MKNRILLTLLGGLCFAHFVKADAKNPIPKIGYANIEYIISVMPDVKAADSDYKTFEQQLRRNIDKKVEEFQTKLQALEKGYETMAEPVKKQKEEELKQLQLNLQRLNIEVQESMNNKHVELWRPIYEKIQKAVKAVAQENGYTHVFNGDFSSLSILLYADEKYDISHLVLKRLGINLPKETGKLSEKK